ncbi:MAG: thiolase domain-containing protein [Deltaproteobacteria bacterium]|nr:thiolase domain-containing protein [Deltaproteobacteria bacterium]
MDPRREGGLARPGRTPPCSAARAARLPRDVRARGAALVTAPVFLIPGVQSDFARNVTREGKSIFDLMRETFEASCDAAAIAPSEIQVAHVGNFVGELFCHQAQLGGLFASMHPSLYGVPTSRHEAACASGSAAILAAQSDILAGHYDLACVLGVEVQRNLPGEQAAKHLGVAAWSGHEAGEARYAWPYLFNRFAEYYEERFGLDHRHLVEISKVNFENARRNPNAQTRRWVIGEEQLGDDPEKNPPVEGMLRRHDCSQITDGAAVVFVASARFAEAYAKRRGRDLASLPRILGWGHRTAPMGLEQKLSFAEETKSPWVLPHMRMAFEDAWRRAGVSGIDAIDAVELHDCFSITEYITIEHLGLAPVGRGFEAVENGTIRADGRRPVNPSGGLMGGGHPIGATGVRQALDACRQVTGTAGDMQVANAKRVQTVNMGGSGTTTISLVVGC